MGARAAIQSQQFTMQGHLRQLDKASGLEMDEWKPTRPIGGWLATYGKIAEDGTVVPTRDRDGQVFEAAQALGRIDFTDYLRKGKLNDTHDEDVIVGFPTLLEFHDQFTDLAKAHRKVGFWTEGYLLDRNDPEGWARAGFTPTPHDFDRADHFWNLATLLKGTPRSLALSAHGKYLPSPCGDRIIYAKMTQGAVCEVPKNPDATLFPLRLSSPLRIEQVGASPCDTCSCPAGACRGLLRKASKSKVEVSDAALAKAQKIMQDADPHRARRVVHLLAMRLGCTEQEAVRWLELWLKTRTEQKEAANGC